MGSSRCRSEAAQRNFLVPCVEVKQAKWGHIGVSEAEKDSVKPQSPFQPYPTTPTIHIAIGCYGAEICLLGSECPQSRVVYNIHERN